MTIHKRVQDLVVAQREFISKSRKLTSEFTGVFDVFSTESTLIYLGEDTGYEYGFMVDLGGRITFLVRGKRYRIPGMIPAQYERAVREAKMFERFKTDLTELISLKNQMNTLKRSNF